MQDPSSHNDGQRAGLVARIDQAARDINAFLLVFAIGLATLDFSCYFAFKLRDALPPVQRADTATAAPQLGFGGGFAKAASDQTYR